MARKTLNFLITDDGRDKGKMFFLEEMSASQAESWATKALLALMQAGIELPYGFERMGMAGLAEVGIRALSGLRWDALEPLLIEMWQCVKFIPDQSKPYMQRPLIEEDIEEVMTRMKIRSEVLRLHVDFLKVVAQLNSSEQEATTKAKRSRSTSTSQA